MGLDTTHECWHGAYSAFCRWRNQIAELAGYAICNVPQTDTFCIPTIMLDWGHFGDEAKLFGEWGDVVPPDPLYYLFCHSDCEGVIHPQQAAPLADALEKLLPELAKLGVGVGHIGNWHDKTKQFVDGLRAAVAANEDVEFH